MMRCDSACYDELPHDEDVDNNHYHYHFNSQKAVKRIKHCNHLLSRELRILTGIKCENSCIDKDTLGGNAVE